MMTARTRLLSGSVMALIVLAVLGLAWYGHVAPSPYEQQLRDHLAHLEAQLHAHGIKVPPALEEEEEAGTRVLQGHRGPDEDAHEREGEGESSSPRRGQRQALWWGGESAGGGEKPTIVDHGEGTPLSEWRTTMRCFQREDFTEICHYKNLCFNGERLLFFSPDIQDAAGQPLVGPEFDVVYDWVYWDPEPYPPPRPLYTPWMSSWGSKHLPAPMMHHPRHVLESVDSVEVMAGAMWWAPGERSTDNLWHQAMETFGLWDAQVLNETLSPSEKLPPIDWVALPKWSWAFYGRARAVLQALVQPHSQYLLFPWFAESSFDLTTLEGHWRMPPEYLAKEHMVESDRLNFEPPPRALAQQRISPHHLVCSRDAVLFSQKARLFSHWRAASLFRHRVFDHVQVPLPPPRGLDHISGNPEQPVFSGRVMIDIRGDGRSRNLYNHADVAAMVKHYGLQADVVDSYNRFDSARKQMEDISQADVYIIVHGAGVTNAIFMGPRSTLIEVSPYGMRVPMYKYLASTLNVNYINVVTFLKGPVTTDNCATPVHVTQFFQQCQGLSNMVVSLNACIALTKHACVMGPLHDLERALINAYDYIGVHLPSRVSQMYSVLHDAPSNDYHHPDNFLWAPDDFTARPVPQPNIRPTWDQVKANL